MDVLMPQLGETVAEGKITKWFKAAGDAVKPGDNLFEIETDKVSMEVPSTTTGVLSEIRVSAGEVAPVGVIVGVIPRARALDPFFELRTPEHNFGPAKLPGGTFVTPLARRLAAEGGIDLGNLSP